VSEENEKVAVVRRIYDMIPAMPEAIRDLYFPDFEMDLTEVAWDVGVVRGLDAADAALRPYYETFDDFHIEIDEVIHADQEHVITALHDGGRMRGSDSEVRNSRFHVWTFRDGKVVRLSAHADKDRALEAAGMSE
jgi:ketosteroid isomerase-like protein